MSSCREQKLVLALVMGLSLFVAVYLRRTLCEVSRMVRAREKNDRVLTCPNRETETLPRFLCRRWAAR